MKYLISYDLDKPGQNYTGLISDLQRSGAVRVLKSAWVINTSWSAVQIRDWVKQRTDSNDRVVVTELDNWAAHNPMAKISEV